MSIPSVQQAEQFLIDGEASNPGPWVAHSRCTAEAARAIAAAHPDLDGDGAYVLGLLHDIGRTCGVSDFRHILDGYRMMTDAGFDDVAVVCVTHSFPLPDLDCYAGRIDCPEADVGFVVTYLEEHPNSEYDRLIQLCDGLCLPTGFCLMEKRLVDVALRYGVKPHTTEVWRKRMEILTHFEAAIGGSVYDLLPGSIENTFN